MYYRAKTKQRITGQKQNNVLQDKNKTTHYRAKTKQCTTAD
jgi:hypothetical protein